MKWSSFQSFTANNYELGHVLDWHIGPPRKFDTLAEKRKWVEEKVMHVRAIPWERLRFDEECLRAPWYHREWWVHFHIKNENPRSIRLKSSFDIGSGSCLAELIDELQHWHSEGWGKPAGECEDWVTHPGDHPMIVEAIVCSQKSWGQNEFSHQSLDFYIPPRGTTL